MIKHTASFHSSASSFKSPQHRGASSAFPTAAAALGAAALLLLGIHPAQAATDTWVGSTSASFSTLNGFNVVPSSGDSLVFNTAGAAGATLNDNLAAGFTFAGLTFNSGASAFTIGGNSFALTGGITNSSTNLQTINDAITLATTQTFSTASGGLTFGGVISGAGGLITTGAGTTTLSAINTFTGGTTVNAGTLALNTSNGAGTVRGVVTVNSGATLSLNQNNALGYSAGSQVTVVNINGGTVTTNGAHTDEGYLTSFNLTGGTLAYVGGNATNEYQFAAADATAPGIMSSASATTSTITGGLNVRTGSLVFNVASGTTASGIDLNDTGLITSGGANGITKTGAGNLVLANGANTFTGNVSVTGGTLTVSNGGSNNGNTALGSDAAAGRTITVGTGTAGSGTLILTPNNVFGGGQSTNTNIPTLVINSGGLVIASAYDGLGPITLNGGTLTQNSTQGNAPAGSAYQGYQFIGNITVGGTSASTISNNYNSVVTNAGDSLGNNTTFNVGVTGASGGDLLVSAPLVDKSNDYGTGNSALIKSGSGTMVLSAANTYNGPTTISAGTLSLTGTLGATNTSAGYVPGTAISSGATFNESSTGVIANGSSLAVTGGTTTLAGANIYTGATTISGGTLQVGTGGTTGSLATGSAITLTSGTLTFDRSDVVTQGINFNSAGISGGGSLTQAGTGTLLLNAANTYTGGTNVNSGILNLTGSLGTGTVAVASGATLTGSGNGTSTGLIGGTVNATGGSAINLATPGTQIQSTGGIVLGNSGTYNSTNFATLNFTLAGSNADEMLNTASALTANNAFVNITNPSQLGTFTLDNYASLTGGSDFSLSSTAGNVLTQNVGRNTETLTVNPTNLMLTIAGAAVPNVAYFNGAVSSVWNDVTTSATLVNFSKNKAGTTDAGNTPGANTDVILNADNATTNRGTTNLSETLGASTTINSLNVNGNGTTTLAADGSTLTINGMMDSNTDTGGGYVGNAAGTGINIASTANPFTVSVPLVLGGSQSYTNASSSLFTVNGTSITGSAVPTSTQTLTLQNTAAGGTKLNTVLGDGTGGGALAVTVNNTPGSGITTLSGANTYTGATTVSSGTLDLNNQLALQNSTLALNGGSVTFDSGVTANAFTLGGLSGSANLALANNAGTPAAIALTLGGNNASNTYSGVLSGAGSLTKNGTGTETFTGANTYTGTTTISGGTLQLGDGTSGDDGTIANSPSIVDNGALVYNRFGTTNSYGGVISGTGSLTKTGVGTQTLTGANTYTGGTTISAGALQLGDGTTTNGSVVGNITDNGALTFADPNAQTYAGVVSGTGSLAKSGAGTETLSAINTFTGGTTVNAGTLQLNAGGGNGGVRNVVTVNSGATLSLNVNNALGYNAGGQVTAVNINGGTVTTTGPLSDEGYRTSFNLTGGTLAYVGGNAANEYQFAAADATAPGISSNASATTSQISGAVNIRSGNLQYTVASGTTPSGIDLLDSGLISGTGFGITKLGAGVLALTGPNTYSGGTTISAGTLEGTTTGLQGAITDNSALAFDQSLSSLATGTYAGVISGTGTVAKNNAGAVILSGANTYTGTTTINGGSLYVNGSLLSTGAVTIAGGGRLGGTGSVGSTTVATGGSVEGGQFNAGTLTTNGLTFSGTGNAYIGNLANYTSTPAIAAGALTANGGANSVSLNVSGAIPGTGTYELLSYSGGSINGTGNSAFQLSTLPNRATGTLDFSNPGLIDLDVTGSDFLIFTGAASPANGWDTVTQNFKLNSNGAPTTYIDNPGDTVVFDDTASTSTVNLNSGDVHPTAVTFNNNTLNYTVQGANAIAGTTGLTKNGTGTLTLTNTNSYTGLTSLNGGVLNVGSAGALGTVSTLSFGGGTLQYSAANQTDYSNRFSTGAGQAYSVDTNGQNVTFANALNSTGGTLTKSGAGALTLGTFSTYSGGTTINGGTLVLTTHSGTGNVQGVITVNPGAALSLTAQDDLGYNVGSQVTQLNINGGTVNNTTPYTNGYSTNVSLTGGTLSSSGGGAFRFNNTTPGAYGITSIASATTSTISSGVDAAFGPLTLNVASGTTPSGIDLLVSGGISSSSIIKTGAGVLALTGTSSYVGTTTISAGTLQLGDGTSGHDGTIPTSPSVIDNSALVYNRFGNTNSYGGVISGTGIVTKTGVGTQTLTGTNTYSGVTTITGGTLQIGNGTAGSIANTSAVTASGGTTLIVDNNAALNNTSTAVNLGDNNGNATVANALNGTVSAPDGNGNVTTNNVQQAGALALGGGTADILNFAGNNGTFDFASGTFGSDTGTTLSIQGFGAASNEMLGASPTGTEVGSDQLLFDTALTPTQLADISFLNSADSSQFGAYEQQITSGVNNGKYQILESTSPAPEPAQTAALGLFGLGLGALILKARKRKADGAAI